jgi:hypothetical protein
MVPDHACVSGLDRPVSVSEYATLKGVREAEVLGAIRALKIRSAFFRGQWYVEAPPNCEERLAQLRGERQPHDTREKATLNADARLLNRPQTNTKTKEEIERHSETERLRVQFVKSHWRYDRLTAAQQQALLGTQKYAERPQPIDYGLSRYDLYTQVGRYPLDESLKCREEASHEWRWIFLVAFVVWACAYGGMLYLHTSGQLKGSSSDLWKLAIVTAPLSLMCSFYLFAMSEGFVTAYRRRRSRPGYLNYQEALELHELYKTTAQAAAHDAEQAILRRKRSYWEFLDGYAFERATAEVLNRHQFNASVTPGSADGGVDIEVTRNGLKGVVQCKAHVACVGPHVVRDLYGVIHHCGADFGIIVSRGGFTRGAIDFARDKPILFLSITDLIAMQEGRDVLAAAFAPRDANNASRQQ